MVSDEIGRSDPEGPPGEALAVRTAKQLVNVGVGGVGTFKGASEVAEECLRHSNGDVEDAVKRAIKLHRRYATTTGGATGLGGFVTLPLTLTAGLASSYIINTRMTATIAYLRGYDLDSEEVRVVLLATQLGSSGAVALQQAGVNIGNKAMLAAVKKVPGKVLIDINKKVGFRLVTKAGTTGAVNLTKLVPLVGAPIGATAENLTTRSVSRFALLNFPPLKLDAEPTDPQVSTN